MDNEFDPIRERLDELEQAIIDLEQEINRSHKARNELRRNINALFVLFCFLSLLVATGWKFKDNRWEWSLESSSIVDIVEATASAIVLAGSGAAGVYYWKRSKEDDSQE